MASNRRHSFSERHHSHHHTSQKYGDYPDHSSEYIPQSYGSRRPILLEREETPGECETRRRRRDETLRRAEDRVQQRELRADAKVNKVLDVWLTQHVKREDGWLKFEERLRQMSIGMMATAASAQAGAIANNAQPQIAAPVQPQQEMNNTPASADDTRSIAGPPCRSHNQASEEFDDEDEEFEDPPPRVDSTHNCSQARVLLDAPHQ